MGMGRSRGEGCCSGNLEGVGGLDLFAEGTLMLATIHTASASCRYCRTTCKAERRGGGLGRALLEGRWTWPS